MSDHECCPRLQYWLSPSIYGEGRVCPVCQCPANPWGHHHVSCGENKDRISRHNSFRNILFVAARFAALSPRREASAFIPGTSSHPADILIPTWCCRQPAALDVIAISTMQAPYSRRSIYKPWLCPKIGEGRKLATYKEICCSEGIDFIPLIMESLGDWSQKLSLTVQRIGHLQGQCFGSPPLILLAILPTNPLFSSGEEIHVYGLIGLVHILLTLMAASEQCVCCVLHGYLT